MRWPRLRSVIMGSVRRSAVQVTVNESEASLTNVSVSAALVAFPRRAKRPPPEQPHHPAGGNISKSDPSRPVSGRCACRCEPFPRVLSLRREHPQGMRHRTVLCIVACNKRLRQCSRFCGSAHGWSWALLTPHPLLVRFTMPPLIILPRVPFVGAPLHCPWPCVGGSKHVGRHYQASAAITALP